MNYQHLQEIIDHYIEKFGELNGPVHMEYYKWRIIYWFRNMMDDALAASDAELPAKLHAVKKLTANVIDSYTQPLNGLVEFSRKEPATVRSMFTELFRVSEADTAQKQEAIQNFLDKSHRLREKYFPDSYLYNDDLHSVTGYLFLYDPDHNYLYKATHCRSFADCIEFYDDWGSGENTKLDVFFRMCDEALAAIKGNDELMKTAASRYELDSEHMHPDTEKHILLFDLIYCCSTYGLFKGISYVVPKSGERKLIQERKEKAQELATDLEKARKNYQALEEAKAYVNSVFKPGIALRHTAFGEGKITETEGNSFTAEFAVGLKSLGMTACVANGLVTLEDAAIQDKLDGYRDILRRDQQICTGVTWAEKALAPYAEYLG